MALDDLLDGLSDDRRAHSLAVARRAASVQNLLPPSSRERLVAAATLHDVGYAHPDTGLHAVDGARWLRSIGMPAAVCSLVAHHTAARTEARLRGLPASIFAEFDMPGLGRSHRIMWWADLTTGPQGQLVTVEDRLADIESRYGPGDVVTRFIAEARDVLMDVGSDPAGTVPIMLG